MARGRPALLPDPTPSPLPAARQVSAVGPTSVSFSDGTSMDAGLVVWSAGVGPQALVADLPWPKSKQHRLLVDPYLRAYADPCERRGAAAGAPA